jgi:2-succinyl-5-enolpyruvyl-6-hydroxy-3-cyclohexene-1-carboxylate synthase
MSNIFNESPETTQPAYISTGAFVDELYRAGLRNVVICPGSRSTVLAMVFAAQTGIRVWMHIDERSASFFALGMAKRLQEPVALVCTSGTAAANFLPAIVEAKLSHVPLLILTADRPAELRDCGAPQAIDQNRLYGTHVKWFAEVALPEATNEQLRYIRTLANRSLSLTTAIPAGPVHLNMPFREPLTPEPLPGQSLPGYEQRNQAAWQGRKEGAPYISSRETRLGQLADDAIQELRQHLSNEPEGLIIAGPGIQSELAGPLLALAQQLNYPILADPLSQLRTTSNIRSSDQVIASYDAFLRLERIATQFKPKIVLRFGAMPTAKPLLLYLKRYPDCPQIIIDGQGDWNEPTQLASEIIHADPLRFCTQLSSIWPDEAEKSWTDWLARWQSIDRMTRKTLQDTMQTFEPLFEGRIFTELAVLLPEQSTLFVGNSMPVRDLDTFFWQSERAVHIMGNRGANGIDGVVSSALGASAATGSKEATVLVIGDLSFLHDLNGLLAAHLHKLDLTIILINNDGGGIFSFLPQATHPEHFEQLFGTPTGLDFRPAIQMYGGSYIQINTWEEYRKAVQQSLDQGGLQVIEVVTERASNVSMHRQLWQSVDSALAEMVI